MLLGHRVGLDLVLGAAGANGSQSAGAHKTSIKQSHIKPVDSNHTHALTGTPPSTPLYQTSVNGALPRISSTSFRSDKREKLASKPVFSAMTISSGCSRDKSTKCGLCVVAMTWTGGRLSCEPSG